MPNKIIKFTGINRTSNEFEGIGTCEELINLRSKVTGGFEIVRTKRQVYNDVNYLFFYEHTFGNVYNEIVVRDTGKVSWINSADGDEYDLAEFRSGDYISICHSNDVLLIYSEEENKQVAFKFNRDKNAYEEYYAAPVRMYGYIDYRSEDTLAPKFVSSSGYAEDGGDVYSTDPWTEALSRAMSKFQSEHSDGLCGAAIVGCTYELEDGAEVWSSAFVVADSNKARVNNETRYNKVPVLDNPNGNNKVTVYGTADVLYCLNFDSSAIKGVKKINVYASRPVANYKVTSSGGDIVAEFKKVSLRDMNLDGQLMYYQGSIMVSGGGTLRLNFSPEKYGEQIMPVTAGAIERIGSSVSLNNRFHYFKSKAYHVIQNPSMSEQVAIVDSFSYWIAYVKFDNQWKLVDRLFTFDQTESQDFIYPMAGISKMAFVKGTYNSSNSFSVSYTTMFYVDMKDSSAYNYSYAFDVVPSIESDNSAGAFRQEIANAGQLWGSGFDDKVLQREESNVINVSMPSNPFAFSVDNSYLFGGEITDAVPSYIPISATMINQFPVTVFTTNGIYALEQGDGGVLYKGITSLQPLKSEGKALATPDGTFFISSKNLYILTGRQATNVSYFINGEIEDTIRDTEAYKKLCLNKDGILYDFSDLISYKTFEEFITGARMIYDDFNNEVIISRDDSSYSYVLNMNSKTFHKISAMYLKAPSGSRHIIEYRGGVKSVVDKYDENKTEQPILLQSRPFSLNTFFSHIQRLILLADAKLSGDMQNLCVSVFASDNLNDWKCVMSSQKRNTALRQIRTNKAPKSYRDYVVLITGYVPTETDISDIIADYTIVQRRLG